MTVTATFLHAVPHRKIATLIRDRLALCREARIISGFATPDGVAALRIGTAAPKIARLVLGAGTFKAFQALDTLMAAGLPASAARLHLGFSRYTGRPRTPSNACGRCCTAKSTTSTCLAARWRPSSDRTTSLASRCVA